VGEASNSANISQCIRAIEELNILSPEDAEALNIIDDNLTAILVNADRKCCAYKQSPWSPELHQAFMEHRYWNLCCSKLRNDRDYSEAYNAIGALLTPTQSNYNPVKP